MPPLPLAARRAIRRDVRHFAIDCGKFEHAGSQRACSRRSFHLSAIVLIVAAIETRPQGAGNYSSGEIGIVLSDDGGGRIPRESGTGGGTASPPAASTVSPPAARTRDHPGRRAGRHDVKHTARGTGSGTRADRATTARRATGRRASACSASRAKVHKFVYVFDRSSSMEGAPLATAKQQLIQSLESLSSVHQFHIIFFNQQMRNFDLSGGGHADRFRHRPQQEAGRPLRRRDHGRRRHRPAARACAAIR